MTGASRGIGRATALALAACGASVCLVGRNADSLSAVKNEAEAHGVSCLTRALDVSTGEELESFIDQIQKHLGSLDILINNAGIYSTSPLSRQPVSEWRQILEVNLTAAMRATRAVLPLMIENDWGRIVNISSISGKSGEPYGSAYSASKFGMLGMTQSVALEVAAHGVTVNAVCPGWVETDMAINQLEDEQWLKLNGIDLKESVEIARLSVPQHRFIQPEEIAHLVAYLCSDDARGITGQAINICGGLSLR